MYNRKTISIKKGVLAVAVVVLLTGILIPSNQAANTYADGSVLFNEGGEVSEDNNNLFWDNTSKRLGIGTNTPSAIIHAQYEGNAAQWYEAITSTWSFWKAQLNFMRARGTIGARQIVQNGDWIGSLEYKAWDGATYRTGARMYAVIDGTPGSNDMPARFIFATTPDGSGEALHRITLYADNGMVINEPGNDYDFRVESNDNENMLFVDASTNRVGIGTNTPLHKLHIHQDFGPAMVRISSNDNMVWITADAGANMPSGFGMLEGGADKAYVYWEGTDDYLSLWESGDNTLICRDGKVGIGTTSPSSTLHVVGKATITGGVDPPYISFSHETHQSIRTFAKNVDEHEKVMQFWNGDAHRMELYVINEDAFYTITGELVGS